uniref:Endonuclease/exonuclease/phosphatase domain-containing protein n=1 Tax=Fagus sylvatica TaxID=28930 RepID=A0A2N9HQ32_FAGSY
MGKKKISLKSKARAKSHTSSEIPVTENDEIIAKLNSVMNEDMVIFLPQKSKWPRSNEDKRGGKQGEDYSANWLKDFMFNTRAIDLGFSGPQFTWSNKREGLANIKERLNRGVCDLDWQSLFPKAGIKHLGALKSDHRPILLDTHMDDQKIVQPFHFEAMWTKDESSNGVVEKAWESQVEGSH